MKPLTISFCDNFLHFYDAKYRDEIALPDTSLVFDDNDLGKCFNALVNNHDVIVFCTHGIKHLANYCFTHYRYVKAAGGLVSAPDGDQLLILRENRWDIPKGMIEPHETTAQAAIREVQEETGIPHPVIDRLILKTYHIYDKYGGWHLKQTSWYAMHCASKPDTTPQTEEAITQAVWVSPQRCLERLSHSFASLKLLSNNL